MAREVQSVTDRVKAHAESNDDQVTAHSEANREAAKAGTEAQDDPFGAHPKAPQDTEFKTFSISGLTCASCAGNIGDRIRERYGPQASLNFGTAKITIPADKVDEAQSIIDSIESGVLIEVKPNDHSAKRSGPPVSLDQLLPLAVASVLFTGGLLFRTTLQATPHVIGEYLAFLAAYVLVGRNVITAAIKNFAKGQLFDENFLMTIATAGAIAIGELPEAVGVMLFYYVGELFQEMAVNRSRRSIQALMDIRPDYANLRIKDDIRRVDPTAVRIGDVIVVRPGERIPLDGEILEGETFVDTSALTGESLPRRARPGEAVLAGSVNKSGFVSIKVTKEYGDSSLAKILYLVENAASRKAPTDRIITRFARYYTPAVVIAAVALAVIPPLLVQGAAFSEWIHRALILLVVSCPCALVVSIPLGYFGGIGGASRQGILIKGANYLEALADVDTVVFDKTGTLTKGTFQVTKTSPANGFTVEELLRYASYAESLSTHPIAISIVQAYGKPIDQGEVEDYEEMAGHGIRAVVLGREVLVGNGRLMARHGVKHAKHEVGGTVAHVAVDGKYAGAIAISDQVRHDAANAIEKLRQLGINKAVMLTGDNKETANEVGSRLGVDEIYSNLLPEDKVTKVEELLGKQKKGRKLAFVGDGINDAPVLTRADVGIAMGGLGSDAAIEAADVVLMEDMPSKLAAAIRIARGTRRIVIQNIAFALATKGLFIALGAVGAATMWAAIFADVGVALLAILNSTRALRIHGDVVGWNALVGKKSRALVPR